MDQRGGGSKRYIHLTPVDNAVKENKQLLEELVSQVNKSKMISKKELRTSMLETIEKKGILKRGSTFQKNLTKKLKESAYIDPDDDDDDYDEEENSNSEYRSYQESQILKELQLAKSMRKSLRKSTIPKAFNKTAMLRKKLRGLSHIEKQQKSMDEIEAEYELEERNKIALKNELENDNYSVIEKKSDESGVLNFENDEESDPNPDENSSYSENKEVNLTKEGVLNFENSIQKHFVWDEPEDEDIQRSKSENVTDNSIDDNRYLDMLSSIIHSISDDDSIITKK